MLHSAQLVGSAGVPLLDSRLSLCVQCCPLYCVCSPVHSALPDVTQNLDGRREAGRVSYDWVTVHFHTTLSLLSTVAKKTEKSRDAHIGSSSWRSLGARTRTIHGLPYSHTPNKTRTENLVRYGDSLKTDAERHTHHPGPAPRSPSQSKRDASRKRSGRGAELMAMPPPRTLGRREEPEQRCVHHARL